MSVARQCPNCFRTESISFNFGDDFEAEKQFHHQSWCNCGYFSPEEMMLDQDLGFTDPRWVKIAKNFENEFVKSMDRIEDRDEFIRFILKLLKNSANNYGLSIEIINKKPDESYAYFYDGKPKNKPRSKIF